MADFGVTTVQLQGRYFALLLNANSTPTDTEAALIIEEWADDVSALLREKGVDPDAVETADGEGARFARRAIIYGALSDCIRASAHDRASADRYYEIALGQMELLRNNVAELGEDRPSGSGSPNQVESHVQNAAAVRTEAQNSNSLLKRMINTGGM